MSEVEQARKQRIAGVFSRAAPSYGAAASPPFNHIGRRLVEQARLQPGAAVLDVAAGRGAVLFPAAEQVGPNGRVIGIDLAEGMVAETALDIQQRGLSNAEVRCMDAEQLEFADASFDAVLCSFALFLFPHPERALAEFQRVLRPGGRVALTTWGERDPRWEWVSELSRVHLGEQYSSTRLAAPSFDKATDLETALRTAGYTDVQVLSEQCEGGFADEEDWWTQQWAHGVRSQVETMTALAREAFKADAFVKLKEVKQNGGLRTVYTVLYTLGTASRSASDV